MPIPALNHFIVTLHYTFQDVSSQCTITHLSHHSVKQHRLESRSRLQGEERSVSEFKHPRGQGHELNQTDQNKDSDFCDQNILGAISLV